MESPKEEIPFFHATYWKLWYRYVKNIPRKVRTLASGKVTWTDTTTGISSTDTEPFEIRWALVKPVMASWWWMRRYGTLPCGCGRNPITHRMSWYSSTCKEPHSMWFDGA